MLNIHERFPLNRLRVEKFQHCLAKTYHFDMDVCIMFLLGSKKSSLFLTMQ